MGAAASSISRLDHPVLIWPMFLVIVICKNSQTESSYLLAERGTGVFAFIAALAN